MRDASGVTAISAYNPINDRVNPWTAIGIGPAPHLSDLPWDQMEVLLPPRHRLDASGHQARCYQVPRVRE